MVNRKTRGAENPCRVSKFSCSERERSIDDNIPRSLQSVWAISVVAGQICHIWWGTFSRAKYSTSDLLDSILLVIRHFLIYSDMQNHQRSGESLHVWVVCLRFQDNRLAERNWLTYISVRKDLTSNFIEIMFIFGNANTRHWQYSDGITVVLLSMRCEYLT